MNDRIPTALPHAASSSVTSGASGTAADHRDVSTESGRVGTLRGATVSFNPRRLVQVALALALVTLTVTAIVLTVAGIHSNDQINRLQTQGQPVTVTVTRMSGPARRKRQQRSRVFVQWQLPVGRPRLP